jgi:hypothetical protein
MIPDSEMADEQTLPLFADVGAAVPKRQHRRASRLTSGIIASVCGNVFCRVVLPRYPIMSC